MTVAVRPSLLARCRRSASELTVRQRTVGWVYHGLCDRKVTWAVARWARDRTRGQAIQLTSLEYRHPRIPQEADGMRLLHVSDLHLGTDGPDVEQVITVAHRAPHDLIVYTGDFLNDDTGQSAVQQLLRDMPKGKRAFAVLGNHDYYALTRHTALNDVPQLLSSISEAGITLLRNDAVYLREFGLHLVGFDDPVSGRCQVDEAIVDVPDGAPTLALAHTPDVVDQLFGWQPELLLAGHTHGGQIVLPIVGPVVRVTKAPRSIASGFHNYKDVPVYVTRGVGCSGINLRVGCAPELVSITFRKSEHGVAMSEKGG